MGKVAIVGTLYSDYIYLNLYFTTDIQENKKKQIYEIEKLFTMKTLHKQKTQIFTNTFFMKINFQKKLAY